METTGCSSWRGCGWSGSWREQRPSRSRRRRWRAARCPGCGRRPGRVHSRYDRRLRDLPACGRPVRVRLARGASCAGRPRARAARSSSRCRGPPRRAGARRCAWRGCWWRSASPSGGRRGPAWRAASASRWAAGLHRVGEASRLLGVPRATLSVAAQEGRLDARKVGKGSSPPPRPCGSGSAGPGAAQGPRRGGAWAAPAGLRRTATSRSRGTPCGAGPRRGRPRVTPCAGHASPWGAPEADALTRVRRAYDRDPGREWARLEGGAQARLEHLITGHALARWPPSLTAERRRVRVLDAGGLGPGADTLEPAARGVRRHPARPLPRPAGPGAGAAGRAPPPTRHQVEAVVEGSVTDLSAFPAGGFDAVLCVGGPSGTSPTRRRSAGPGRAAAGGAPRRAGARLGRRPPGGLPLGGAVAGLLDQFCSACSRPG